MTKLGDSTVRNPLYGSKHQNGAYRGENPPTLTYGEIRQQFYGHIFLTLRGIHSATYTLLLYFSILGGKQGYENL